MRGMKILSMWCEAIIVGSAPCRPTASIANSSAPMIGSTLNAFLEWSIWPNRPPSIGVVGAYRLADRHVDLVSLPYQRSIFDGRQIIADSFRSRVSVLGSPTALLYRSDLVRARQPFYDESFRHADTEVGYWALMRSDFGMVHQVLTFSRTPSRSES